MWGNYFRVVNLAQRGRKKKDVNSGMAPCFPCLEKGGGLLFFFFFKWSHSKGKWVSSSSQAGLCSQGTLAGSLQAGPTWVCHPGWCWWMDDGLWFSAPVDTAIKVSFKVTKPTDEYLWQHFGCLQALSEGLGEGCAAPLFSAASRGVSTCSSGRRAFISKPWSFAAFP